MNKLIKISKKYNLKIIEDCAEAHGATINNKKIGTFGDLNCYSFYKVAAESFKKAGKEKNLINNLEKSADVSLKYNYDLGEIMGFKPEVMAEMTKSKVGTFVKLANKDFSSLAKKYGLVCKNLIENPKERTSYWEQKGAKIIKWKEKI